MASLLAPSSDTVSPGEVVSQQVRDSAGYLRFRSIVDRAEVPVPGLPDAAAAAAAVGTRGGLPAGARPGPRVRRPVAGQRAWSPDGVGVGIGEGRSFYLGISPGVVEVRLEDLGRSERARERAARARVRDANLLAAGVKRDPDGSFTLPAGDGLPPAEVVGVFSWLPGFRSLVDKWGVGFSPDRGEYVEPLTLPPVFSPRAREVTAWSSRSRRKMLRTVGALDFSDWTLDSDGSLSMVTLTLPGEWESLAPKGADFKRMIERLRRRWVRATGGRWRCVWKLEFQRRGAPHWHALMRVPALVRLRSGRRFVECPAGCPPVAGFVCASCGERLETWLSRAWADVVGADDVTCLRCGWDECRCEAGLPRDTSRARHARAGTRVDLAGSKCQDPRRIAVYFLGHSAKSTDGKEYQHRVPLLWQASGQGPGRFWGVSGLGSGMVQAEVSDREYYAVRRVLRSVARAKMGRRDRDRARRGLPPVRRGVLGFGTSGGSPGRLAGGWVLVNDGVSLGFDLARYLAMTRGEGPPAAPTLPARLPGDPR